MELGLKNKTALITGAGSGIGKAIAQALVGEGVSVALCDLNAEAISEIAFAAKQSGIRAIDMAFDVSDENACLLAVNKAHQEFESIDILINSAGICPFHTLDEISADEWDKVMQINLKSAFILSRAVLALMKERRWGRIINISSMAGKVGGLTVAAHYSASKAGMICLTKTLAREGAAFGITANALAPAFIRTPLFAKDDLTMQIDRIPVGRVGEPEEVADAALFLASEKAGFITGATIDINGGLLMD